MAGDPFREVRAGEPMVIPAQAWNGVMRVAREATTRATGFGRTPQPGPIEVAVRNDSGVALNRFGVLAIDAPLIDPSSQANGFLGRMAVSGVAVTAANLGSFAMALEPIGPGRIGRGIMRGVVTGTVKQNSTGHKFATPVSGSSVLETASTGPVQLLWIQGAGPLGNIRHAIMAIDGQRGEQRILAKITGASADGSNKWTYSWEQVENVNGSFNTVAGGLASGADGVAHNWIEANNNASGVQGNGVDLANLPAGFAIQPIGTGAVVELSGPIGYTNKSENWFFAAVNAVDGTCP